MGFKLAEDYVVKRYSKLLDMFERSCRFSITLELTLKDGSKVPGWKEIKKELCSSL